MRYRLEYKVRRQMTAPQNEMTKQSLNATQHKCLCHNNTPPPTAPCTPVPVIKSDDIMKLAFQVIATYWSEIEYFERDFSIQQAPILCFSAFDKTINVASSSTTNVDIRLWGMRITITNPAIVYGMDLHQWPGNTITRYNTGEPNSACETGTM